MVLDLKEKSLYRFILFSIVALVLIHTFFCILKFVFHHDYVYGLSPLFNLDREFSVPAYFSFGLLVMISFLFLCLSKAIKEKNKPDSMYCLSLTAIAFFLAIDELFSIHEKLIEPVRTFFNISGFFYFAWIIPYGILTILFVILFYRWWSRRESRFKFLLTIGFFVYILAVIGIESIGGYVYEYFGPEAVSYAILVIIEETLEMIGLFILIHAIFSHLKNNLSVKNIKLTNSFSVTISD